MVFLELALSGGLAALHGCLVTLPGLPWLLGHRDLLGLEVHSLDRDLLRFR